MDEKVTIPSNEIMYALCDDLNTSVAFSELIQLFYKLRQSESLAEKKMVKAYIFHSSKLLGLFQQDPKEWLGYQSNFSKELSKDIELLIEKRNIARNNKDFELADQCRDKLQKKNIFLEDTPNGTIWKFID